MQTGTHRCSWGDGKSKASLGRAPSSQARSDHSVLCSVPVSNRHQGSWKNTPRSRRVHPSTKPPRERRLPRGLRELLGLSDCSTAQRASISCPGSFCATSRSEAPFTGDRNLRDCRIHKKTLLLLPYIHPQDTQTAERKVEVASEPQASDSPHPNLHVKDSVIPSCQGTSDTSTAKARQAFPALSACSQ